VYRGGGDMSRRKCYTSGYTGKHMEHAKVRRLIKNKTKMITVRINPELLQRFDNVLQKDKQYASRNDFIEDCILRYLESKGKI
jgi:hypothetical protein